jgi:hypothetical protein
MQDELLERAVGGSFLQGDKRSEAVRKEERFLTYVIKLNGTEVSESLAYKINLAKPCIKTCMGILP